MITLPWTAAAKAIMPARVVTITLSDGTIIRVAEAQDPVTVGGTTWSPAKGFVLSALKKTADGSPWSCTITASAIPGGSPFDAFAIADLKYDDATVEVFAVDLATKASAVRIFRGKVGQITQPTGSKIQIEVRGVVVRAQSPYSMTFGSMCRTDLGSLLCGVPIRPKDWQANEGIALGNARRFRFASGGTPDDYQNVYLEALSGGTTGSSPPAFTSTVGATYNDNGILWKVRDSFTRHAKIASIVNGFALTLDRNPDPRATDNWYNQGVMLPFNGYSAGKGIEVAGWSAATLQVTTYLPLWAAGNSGVRVSVGDWVEIWRGCDFTIGTCAGVFGNSLNMQAEPYYAGTTATSATVQGA